MIAWLVAALLAAGSLLAQDEPTVDGLRQELATLRAEAERNAQRIQELTRLRVAWDLLVPVDESEITVGTTPAEGSLDLVKARLAEESVRTRQLTERLAALSQLRIPDTTSPVVSEPVEPPPRPGGVAPTLPPTPVSAVAPAPIAAAVSHVPRAAPSTFAPPVPVVLDPFARGGRPVIHVMPTPSLKRIGSLVAVGLHREALLVLDEALAAAPDDPALSFLKARSLELAGRQTEARVIYQRLSAIGKERDSGGWADAAELALRHDAWRVRLTTVEIPDARGIVW